jgi:succinate dehydrogenase / fumarate reductase cytochrome b subunit
MSWFRQYARSSIGMKQLMAVTGLALAGFVLVHMVGNLQGLGPILWLLRGGLLVVFLVHVAAGVRLAKLNSAARPETYRMFKPQKIKWYSRLMPMTGVFLLLFLVVHLGHFTFGVIDPDAFALKETVSLDHTRHDVYGMLVTGFLDPVWAYGYIGIMAFLCMHLAHGVTSFLQSMGLNHPKYNGFFGPIGPIYGWVLFIGNISMPLAVQWKVLEPLL